MSDAVGIVLRREILARADGRCEYCLMPEGELLYPHEPDHIIAVKHGGPTVRENLAYACFDCNRAKGSDIASLDPLTGALTPLYSPRLHAWSEHFRFNGPVIEAITPIGRVTVALLDFNVPMRVSFRVSLMGEARYPLPGVRQQHP